MKSSIHPDFGGRKRHSWMMSIFHFEPRPVAAIHSEKEKERKARIQCYFAEFIGTFILVFADAGVGMAASLTGDEVTLGMRAITPGLAVLAMIFALGERSGAHINPAVTWAFSLRGVFPWRRLPVYWVLQIAGALAAALLLRAMFGNVGGLGGTTPQVDVTSAFGMETCLTFLLAFVILSTSHQSKLKGPEAAFPVGATVALCGLVGKGISGASMNPARSLGPAIVGGHLDSIWIYLAGPFLGALLAVIGVFIAHGQPKEEEEIAAKGEKNVRP